MLATDSGTPEVVDFNKYTEDDYERGRTKAITSLLYPGEGGVAIDAGSGPGYYTRILSSTGWKVLSIDLEESNLEQVKPYADTAILGNVLEVLKGLEAESADLILELEIIEHMTKDLGEQMLRDSYKILKPGGKLIVSTPNVISPEGCYGRLWQEKIRGGPKWMAWCPYHVHIYSSFELLRLLKKVGFSIETVIGYYFDFKAPLIGDIHVPFTTTKRFPLNRLAYKTIVKCSKS